MTDQNGTVHAYDYDKLGRRTQDRVTTLGSGVDGAIRRIASTYDVRGLRLALTSYDNSSVGSGNVVNDVQFAYNDFGQLVTDYQAHGGAVNTSTTPKVLYGYADGSANTIRPTSMTYPNGTQLEYRYDDPDANNLSRIRTLHWDGSDVCSYNYLGLKTFVTTDYLQPQVQLDYALGSGANPYAGFDRFGRIIDLLWAKYGVDSSSSSSNGGQGNSVVHLKYGYDRESNRTHREDLVAQAYGKNFDELYEYDGLHRLKKFHRGRLTVDNQTITSPTLQQGWVLDATGNWQNFTQNDQADANRTLDQQRLANRVNEITQIARTVGQQWATPEYDKNGNMTTIPQLEEPTATYKGTWDAWNRLVKLEEPNGDGGWQNLMQYQYDGQAWRIISLKHSGGIAEETKHVYFTSQWQEIEVRVGTTPIDAPASQQFVWGERYIDDLLLRDRDSTSEGFLNERLYVTQDANWNVVAISNTEGSILARIAYSPYGVDSDLNSAFEECDAETLSWTRRYHGYSQCQVTFLFNVRMRSYHPCLGIWISRDPDGYGLDANLYLFDRANPLAYIDFTGKKPLSDKEKEELKGCLCRVNEGAPQDGLAWVECDGKGGLRVKYLPKDDIPSPVDQGCFKTCGAYNCTGSHERVHIEQIKHVNPDVCKGKIAGGHIQVSSDCTSIFECRAHVVDQDCLLNIFDKLSKKDKPCTLPDGSRRSCKSYIQNSITERKQKVEQKYKCKDKAINLPGLP